jgi:SAM-dependent methyltransferase
MDADPRFATENDFRDAVKNAYSLGAIGYARSWPVPHPWMAEMRAEFQKRLPANGRILDVGSGPGNDTAYWQHLGYSAIGIDASEGMVQAARARHPDCEFLQMDLRNCPSLGQRFDGVWAAYVMLHLPVKEFRQGLEALHSVLKQDGVLFLATAIGTETREFVKPIAGLNGPDEKELPVPFNVFDLDELRGVLNPLFAEEWAHVEKPIPDRSSAFDVILRRR